ncbi:MAG: hypothetical protein K5739_02905 [Lachnospiraceae bacterium]|nr:hypothetical protein [Lachnospiraceae bacterium]
MKYAKDEALSEVLKRSRKVRERRAAKAKAALSSTAVLLFTSLVWLIGALPMRPEKLDDSVYGSFMLSQDAGGLVLVAVLAFSLGMLLTILILHWRNSRNNEERNGGNEG